MAEPGCDNEVFKRIKAHIAQMAPHQEKRRAGRLLIEASEEIKRLSDQCADWRELRLKELDKRTTDAT